jgi:hypothetical protein
MLIIAIMIMNIMSISDIMMKRINCQSDTTAREAGWDFKMQGQVGKK